MSLGSCQTNSEPLSLSLLPPPPILARQNKVRRWIIWNSTKPLVPKLAALSSRNQVSLAFDSESVWVIVRRSPMETIQSREREVGLGKYKDSNEERGADVMRKSKEHRPTAHLLRTENLLLLM